MPCCARPWGRMELKRGGEGASDDEAHPALLCHTAWAPDRGAYAACMLNAG